MNKHKRAILKSVKLLLEAVKTEEAQDLKDTPDNIEGSEFAKARFKDNIGAIDEALANLDTIN